jgi:hypothetical protein
MLLEKGFENKEGPPKTREVPGNGLIIESALIAVFSLVPGSPNKLVKLKLGVGG